MANLYSHICLSLGTVTKRLITNNSMCDFAKRLASNNAAKEILTDPTLLGCKVSLTIGAPAERHLEKASTFMLQVAQRTQVGNTYVCVCFNSK